MCIETEIDPEKIVHKMKKHFRNDIQLTYLREPRLVVLWVRTESSSSLVGRSGEGSVLRVYLKTGESGNTARGRKENYIRDLQDLTHGKVKDQERDERLGRERGTIMRWAGGLGR